MGVWYVLNSEASGKWFVGQIIIVRRRKFKQKGISNWGINFELKKIFFSRRLKDTNIFHHSSHQKIRFSNLHVCESDKNSISFYISSIQFSLHPPHLSVNAQNFLKRAQSKINLSNDKTSAWDVSALSKEL